MRNFLVTILLIGSLGTAEISSEILETIAQWPLLDYALPYDREYLAQFRPENVVPTGFEVSEHRIFIATPRIRAGVPATLSVIPRDLPLGSSPQLDAYPSWDWHGTGKGNFNCSGLISVYRIRIDKCNRLWVLDSGINTSVDDFQVLCPPKLLVFDLQTDQLVRQVIFPREVLRPDTLLTNLVIDDTEARTCDDVFVYITDTVGPGLLVFDGTADRSWRYVHASMLPDPNFSTYRIGSDTFELFDGVVGLTFSPRENLVYYQPLATDRIFSVSSLVLKAGPLPFGQQLPVTVVGKKSSQGLALTVNQRDNSLIFSPFTETAIASWSPATNKQRVLAFSAEKLQFVAELMWYERDNGNIWILSSRFQKYFNRQVNPREINPRLLRIRSKSPLLVPPSIYHYNPHFPINIYNNTLTHFVAINMLVNILSFMFLSSLYFTTVNSAGKFETVYKWYWVDYLWESETQRLASIITGEYNYTKPVIIDVDVWKDKKVFVTVIRTDGVPASLTTISGKIGGGGPLLKPYPSWSWARKGDCYSITSVFRVAIDECDRLWVLDTGKINEEHVCPAQLLAFDLKTDILIKRVRIPRDIAINIVTKKGLLVTPIVETQGVYCSKTFVYIADVTGNALIIYNGTSLWRVESPIFQPQEAAASVTIANETFYLDDGVLGMALSPKSSRNPRQLILRPLASFDIISVETSSLQKSYANKPIRYTVVSRALPSQAAAMAFSSGGTLFFGLPHDLAMACWNINKPLTRDNIVVIDRDHNDYQFVSGVKVIPSRFTKRYEELWIATNRYQKIALETQNFNEINFRIMKSPVDNLIKGTNCNNGFNFKFLSDYNLPFSNYF
ncbi:uncharacterized protein LOC141524070 [Cotesia typhae]|uniref:uncharacterized protein LOC141524070 n=1 Tax=Cotesia typhae TaxID=2053667 RepID=UPI003D6988C9